MIVMLSPHSRHAGVVVAKTPRELAQVMGGFAPARWSADDGGYLLEVEQVTALVRYLEFRGHRALDQAPVTGGGVGPLPECGSCRRPVRRRAAASFDRCPHCGVLWEPWVYRHDPDRWRLESVPCPPAVRAVLRSLPRFGDRWSAAGDVAGGVS